MMLHLLVVLITPIKMGKQNDQVQKYAGKQESLNKASGQEWFGLKTTSQARNNLTLLSYLSTAFLDVIEETPCTS